MLFSFSPCGQTYFSCLLYDHQVKYFICCRDGFSPSFSPPVGMEFSSTEEARMFWVSYGSQKGFEVRKRYSNKKKSDGNVRLCRFVCANEGH